MQSWKYFPHTSKIAIFIHLTSLTATQLHCILFVFNINCYKLSLRRRCMIHVERTMGNWNNINTRIPRKTTRTTLVTKNHLRKLSKQVEKIAFGNLFWSVSQWVQIHFVFTEIYVYCVYIAMPKSLNSNCNISEQKQASIYVYFGKNKMYLHSLRDRPEKVTKGYLFYLFRKLAQMIFCFPRKCNSNNRIIYETRSSYDLQAPIVNYFWIVIFTSFSVWSQRRS
jgi:hypothetical protein